MGSFALGSRIYLLGGEVELDGEVDFVPQEKDGTQRISEKVYFFDTAAVAISGTSHAWKVIYFFSTKEDHVYVFDVYYRQWTALDVYSRPGLLPRERHMFLLPSFTLSKSARKSARISSLSTNQIIGYLPPPDVLRDASKAVGEVQVFGSEELRSSLFAAGVEKFNATYNAVGCFVV
ncbi:hypothetical protein RHMOL_Rhmol03G0198700 [Rhododendron molle]|uniref:Uncharacterized protein n=1 Tax=Rhododendron molle TaxID=49168 RepID=A0ACC0PI01_RHOML|nr:hypothetical protein RHMOL_Rhmol03G0198700 [Rhododendron molle]